MTRVALALDSTLPLLDCGFLFLPPISSFIKYINSSGLLGRLRQGISMFIEVSTYRF